MAIFLFHLDDYGYATASCLEAYPELSCFKSRSCERAFVMSKLETNIPREKIPASRLNPRSDMNTLIVFFQFSHLHGFFYLLFFNTSNVYDSAEAGQLSGKVLASLNSSSFYAGRDPCSIQHSGFFRHDMINLQQCLTPIFEK